MEWNQLISEDGVVVDDELLLVVGESPPLDVRAEVVGPAAAAALAAAVEAGEPGEEAPVAVSVLVDVVHQQLVLLGRPPALLHARVGDVVAAARCR